MGGDAQLDKVTNTLNTGSFDKATVVNRPQILARPLAPIHNDENILFYTNIYRANFCLSGKSCR